MIVDRRRERASDLWPAKGAAEFGVGPVRDVAGLSGGNITANAENIIKARNCNRLVICMEIPFQT